MARRAVAAIGVLAAAGVAVALVWHSGSGTTPAAAAPVLKTATVELGTLTSSEKVDGQVVLADNLQVVHRASRATVTSVIDVGAHVGLGDVLYTADSAPVVALHGTMPAWRTLATSSDPGEDIDQLEKSLVALGYDPAGDVTVDDTFDSHTRAMVERWQTGLGREATGKVELGSVVFVPDGTDVTSVAKKVGDVVGDGDVMLALAGTRYQVVIDVPADQEGAIVPGLPVTLGTSGTGTVSLLRSIVRDGAAVVQAVIDPAAGFTGSEGPINVTVAHDVATRALLVPAEALLSKLDGSYVVQVQQPDGTDTFHTVDVVAVSGTKAAITGAGISQGTLVLLPV